MKTAAIFFIRSYFRVLSGLWPKKAAKVAFRFFQRTQKLPFKKAEQEFYKRARKLEVVHPVENIHAYELGDSFGKLSILVHGWNSNAGSMGAIASALVREGYRVVALDLPAHGRSRLTHTNLRECREALCALIYQLRPTAPFTIISHSFGSAVATLALADTRYRVDNFIMLTSPNKLIDIFDEFKKQIALGGEAYQQLLCRAYSILKEPVENVTVEAKALKMRYQKLVIMHDAHDKVLPYSNAVRLSEALPNTRLVTLKNSGHYRMLWSNEIIRKVIFELTQEKPEAPELSEYVTELLDSYA